MERVESLTLLEQLLLKALELGKTPEDFVQWARAYREVLASWAGGESPSPRPKAHERSLKGPLLKGPLLPPAGVAMSFPQRVAEVVTLLHAHSGEPLDLEAISNGVSGMPLTSVYPTISKAREIMAEMGLPADDIIRTISRRGTGRKAMYVWAQEYSLES